MTYTVLSRKWRPFEFDQVIGQEHITAILSKSLLKQKVSHAYLFSGPRGVGKTSVARILASSLNGVNLAHESIDIIELDGASNRGIDEIRELKDSVRFSPAEGKYKVFIIDESHMLTKEAFNALLKTIEEPPSHVVFILATTEISKIPPTISSRCQKYDFKKINEKDIASHLMFVINKEGIIADKKSIRAISIKADGSLRDGLSLLDKVIALSDNEINYDTVKEFLGIIEEEQYLAILKAILEKNYKIIFSELRCVADSGFSLIHFLDGFNCFLRDVVYFYIKASSFIDFSNQTKSYLSNEKIDFKFIGLIINLIIEFINSKKGALNLIDLENLFLKITNLQLNSRSLSLDDKSVNDVQNSDKKNVLKDSSSLVGLNKSFKNNLSEFLMAQKKDNPQLYCVLEKTDIKIHGKNSIKIGFENLNTYELNTLKENLNQIKSDIFNLYGEIVSVDIQESIDIKDDFHSTENDIKKDGSIGSQIANHKTAQDHPLFDVAMGDLKGKLIK